MHISDAKKRVLWSDFHAFIALPRGLAGISIGEAELRASVRGQGELKPPLFWGIYLVNFRNF